MELKRMPYELFVCKDKEINPKMLSDEYFLIGKTDEEISPAYVTEHTDIDFSGYSAFRR